VVVAIDDYHGRRVYTVDDSSGVNIECLVTVPAATHPTGASTTAETETKEPVPAAPAATETRHEMPGVDVGHVVDVRGGLSTFRDHKQIKVEKMVIVKSTDQEVKFWTKAHEFRRDVISQPWALDEREVRRCRREAEGVDVTRERKRRKKEGTQHQPSGKRHRQREVPATRPEEKTKRRADPVGAHGKYNALGL